MKYRKKPVVVEAIRIPLEGPLRPVYDWFKPEEEKGLTFGPENIGLHTLEGTMVAFRGDWIIRGVAGELYPCKHEIFVQTYEAEP